MIIPCPLHNGCKAWTGEERRDADGDYQWECMSGITWQADASGDPGDEEGCPICGCEQHSCAADCDCCPEHRDADDGPGDDTDGPRHRETDPAEAAKEQIRDFHRNR